MRRHDPYVEFNRMMDTVIEKTINEENLTAEYRSKFVHAVSLYRRVAEYSPPLAIEIYLNMVDLSSEFTIAIVREVFKSLKAEKDVPHTAK